MDATTHKPSDVVCRGSMMTVESQGDRCMRENYAWKKWKTWCVFHGKCWGCDVPVLPLTPKHMYGIAAMFTSCGYRSYVEYVRAAKGMHIQSGAAWSNKLKLTFRETITMCYHNDHGKIMSWNRYLARDPPSYDSGIPLSEADAKTMMDKIEARSKWHKANGKAHEVKKHVGLRRRHMKSQSTLSLRGIVIWHAIHRAMTVEHSCRRQMRRQ